MWPNIGAIAIELALYVSMTVLAIWALITRNVRIDPLMGVLLAEVGISRIGDYTEVDVLRIVPNIVALICIILLINDK